MPYRPDIRGWMSPESMQTIMSWARHVPKNGVIVEIGSMMGRTACGWAMSAPTATVYCIDPWLGEPQGDCADAVAAKTLEGSLPWFPRQGDYNDIHTFLKNTEGLSNIRTIQTDTSSGIFLEADVVFIDAAHSNPSDWAHIMHWLPLIKKGGRLCGHDYEMTFPDVVNNVQTLETILEQKVVTYDEDKIGNSLWSFMI